MTIIEYRLGFGSWENYGNYPAKDAAVASFNIVSKHRAAVGGEDCQWRLIDVIAEQPSVPL